jgi:hypothetical protein
MVSWISEVELRLLLFRDAMREKLGRVSNGHPKLGVWHLPHPAPPDHKAQGIAIVALAKDEGYYLAEWLEFHLMLGVRHIYLYDNGSSDNSPDVLRPYLRDGSATLLPWRNFSATLNPQSLAYNHALANFGLAYRWMAFVDLDEFLFPSEGDSLEQTMARLEHLPSINLPWICFGPSGHQTRPAGLVIENYTERGSFPPRSDQNRLLKYKSIVNPREIVASRGAHQFVLREEGVMLINDRGVKFRLSQHKDPSFATADHLRLHHYITKSFEDMDRKRKRGRVTLRGKVDPKALNHRYDQLKLYTEQDRTIFRFIPELKRRLAVRYPEGSVAAGAPVKQTAA